MENSTTTPAADPLAQLYENKADGYFAVPRAELISFVPKTARRILDVGCGDGSFAAKLKQDLQAECWGVEPATKAAAMAQTKLDKALLGFFGPDLDLPENYFDLICFNDVLEHIATPADTLRVARRLLRPGGKVMASIPNFRYITNMWNLLVRNRAVYEDSGIMDRTHLRVFIKSSIPLLFSEAGFRVETLQGINPTEATLRFTVLNTLTLGAIEDMRWLQYVVVASPAE